MNEDLVELLRELSVELDAYDNDEYKRQAQHQGRIMQIVRELAEHYRSEVQDGGE